MEELVQSAKQSFRHYPNPASGRQKLPFPGWKLLRVHASLPPVLCKTCVNYTWISHVTTGYILSSELGARESQATEEGKKWQSINTNHWCGKLILDCFSGFVQNCFVEGKKEIKALIILGNSFHKINPPFLKGLFRCGNVVSVTRQGYNETQQTRCSPISHFKLSSSIFRLPSLSDRLVQLP